MTRRYHGHAGHFIGAQNSCHHLCTRVNGKWLVSTVGCYHPGGKKDREPEQIGLGRLFETMVFPIDEDTGEVTSWTEHARRGYQDAVAADVGHEAMCQKYETAEMDAAYEGRPKDEEDDA